MKRVRNQKPNEQCQARTKSGKRCRRDSITGSAFCSQHDSIFQDALWSHPGGEINYIPKHPSVLSDKAAGFWSQYCKLLLEHDMLWGVYLGDLAELCWRIDYRDELLKDIENKGLVNHYDKGVQLIGFDKILDRNDKMIRDLKKQFGFTLDTASKLSKGKATKQEADKKKDNITPMVSVKNF